MPGERAEIRFEADGRVALVLGTQSNGQGHETSFAQIAADLLGLPVAAFRFVQADTRTVKSGNGHGGARSMHGEIEAVVDSFTVDAILKSPVIDISGRDEIRAFAGHQGADRCAIR